MNIYLFTGQETEKKEKEIEKLKAALLKDKDAKQFDYDSLSQYKSPYRSCFSLNTRRSSTASSQ